ncbi:MAG: hypothetical protein WC756_19080 [Taibaiella sp.]
MKQVTIVVQEGNATSLSSVTGSFEVFQKITGLSPLHYKAKYNKEATLA